MWAFCKNSVPDGTCKGFLLLNGKSENLLNKTLSEDNKIYLQECTRRIQYGSHEPLLVSEVLRYIQPQPTEHKSGFLAMLEAARPSNLLTAQEPESESRPNSQFIRMLEAASTKGKGPIERQSSASIIQRQNSFAFENQLPEVCNDGCFIRRHCSSYPAQLGRTCVKLESQYVNRTFIHKEGKTE
jgi:hypothetical protein